VSTQLRLVEAPTPSGVGAGGGDTKAEKGTKAKTANHADGRPAKAVRASVRASVRGVPAGSAARTGGSGRRAVRWGEWQLDARTRRVGREGVAAARRALEEARLGEELSQAS